MLSADRGKFYLPFSVLKQDHPHDCAKNVSSCAAERRRVGPKPHNLWETLFLKKCKWDFCQLRAFWGFSYPKFTVTSKRSRSATIKKKVNSPTRDRFGLKHLAAQERLWSSKNLTTIDYGPKPSPKNELFSSQKVCSSFTLLALLCQSLFNGHYSCGIFTSKRKTKPKS